MTECLSAVRRIPHDDYAMTCGLCACSYDAEASGETADSSADSTITIDYFWGKDLSGTIGGAGGVGGLLYLKRNGAIYIPFYDAFGNIVGYWDENGTVVAEYTYDAFGSLISESGSMADSFSILYSTKYRDRETDLYYYGYRYYAPSLHRWLTRDPIGELGGKNLYLFCNNRAVVDFDFDGRRSWTEATARKEVLDKAEDMLKNGYFFAAEALEAFLHNEMINKDLSYYAADIYNDTDWQWSFIRCVMSELRKLDPARTGKVVQIGDIMHKGNFDRDLRHVRFENLFQMQFEHRFWPQDNMGLFYALYGSRYTYVGEASWRACSRRTSSLYQDVTRIMTNVKIVSWDKLTYPQGFFRNMFPSYSAASYLEREHHYATPDIFLRWQEISQWQLKSSMFLESNDVYLEKE